METGQIGQKSPKVSLISFKLLNCLIKKANYHFTEMLHHILIIILLVNKRVLVGHLDPFGVVY